MANNITNTSTYRHPLYIQAGPADFWSRQFNSSPPEPINDLNALADAASSSRGGQTTEKVVQTKKRKHSADSNSQTTTTVTKRTRVIAPLVIPSSSTALTLSSPQKDQSKKVANLKRKLKNALKSNGKFKSEKKELQSEKKDLQKELRTEKKARRQASIKIEETALEISAYKKQLDKAHGRVLVWSREAELLKDTITPAIEVIAELSQKTETQAATEKQLNRKITKLRNRKTELKEDKKYWKQETKHSEKHHAEMMSIYNSLHEKMLSLPSSTT